MTPTSQFPEIEKLVYVWILFSKSRGINVSDKAIREKAREEYSRIYGKDWNPSNGWVAGFKSRIRRREFSHLGPDIFENQTTDNDSSIKWYQNFLVSFFEFFSFFLLLLTGYVSQEDSSNNYKTTIPVVNEVQHSAPPIAWPRPFSVPSISPVAYLNHSASFPFQQGAELSSFLGNVMLHAGFPGTLPLSSLGAHMPTPIPPQFLNSFYQIPVDSFSNITHRPFVPSMEYFINNGCPTPNHFPPSSDKNFGVSTDQRSI